VAKTYVAEIEWSWVFVAGARVRSAGAVRLFASTQVLPVLALRADVYGPGRRADGHPGMQIDVSGSSAPL